MEQCPTKHFPDETSKECLECSYRCGVCNKDESKSCSECEAIHYLFNGVCVETCPSPDYEGQYSDYTCKRVTDDYIDVSILSLGYKKRIPKDKQAYMKVAINNKRGLITSILWE